MQGLYKFETNTFEDIPSLINYHHENSIVIQSVTGAMLINPIVCHKEFLHSDINLKSRLGSGHFGDVFQGELLTSNLQVAVKTCKPNVDEVTKRKFLDEAGIMQPCNHQNVLKMIGICKDEEPYYISK